MILRTAGGRRRSGDEVAFLVKLEAVLEAHLVKSTMRALVIFTHIFLILATFKLAWTSSMPFSRSATCCEADLSRRWVTVLPFLDFILLI